MCQHLKAGTDTPSPEWMTIFTINAQHSPYTTQSIHIIWYKSVMVLILHVHVISNRFLKDLRQLVRKVNLQKNLAKDSCGMDLFLSYL